jgi:thiaminase
VGQSEDWLALQVAQAPCLLGYAAVARMLHEHEGTKREGNTYWAWIKNYIAEDYSEAVRLGSGTVLLGVSIDYKGTDIQQIF